MPNFTLRPRNEPGTADLPPHEAWQASLARIEITQILKRWNGCERFVVLDTHFDAGLNFLATWRAWRADPQRPQQLHYLAIEAQPYKASALAALHTAWPEFATLSPELLAAWPVLTTGFHRLALPDRGVTLTLIFGEPESSLRQIDAQVDAFYVDAGSIASAPSLLSLLARLAAPQAMLAMEAEPPPTGNSGFVFDAVPPSTHSRHIVCGKFAPRWTPPPLRVVAENRRHAIVIGAGLAGAAACERFAARGWQVSLIEQHERTAQEASGNLAGIFAPTLTQDDNPSTRLTRNAFLFALHLWECIGGIGKAFSGEACGVLQFARDATHARAAQKIAESGEFPAEFAQWLNTAEAAALIGMPATESGAWLFPQGGWAHPGGVCEALLTACGNRLDRYFTRQVLRLERANDDWQVIDQHGAVIAQAPHVVIANGAGARKFTQTAGLPLDAVRGQVTHLPAGVVPDLPLIVCCDGYLTRPFNGLCSAGASYDADADPLLRPSSQQQNLARLERMLPGISATLKTLPLAGRVGFRCVSPDRLPLVGALPDMEALTTFRGDRLRDVPRLPGLYGLLGYASRGLIWAPLAAELLAAQIAGEPLPLERELVTALDPARFCLRAHRRLDCVAAIPH